MAQDAVTWQQQADKASAAEAMRQRGSGPSRPPWASRMKMQRQRMWMWGAAFCESATRPGPRTPRLKAARCSPCGLCLGACDGPDQGTVSPAGPHTQGVRPHRNILQIHTWVIPMTWPCQRMGRFSCSRRLGAARSGTAQPAAAGGQTPKASATLQLTATEQTLLSSAGIDHTCSTHRMCPSQGCAGPSWCPVFICITFKACMASGDASTSPMSQTNHPRSSPAMRCLCGQGTASALYILA